MPLESSNVFASHIGHTGKSTLCFQVACWVAQQSPEVSVLVVDFAEEGDLTKRLLGGADNVKTLVTTLFGGIFQLAAEADRSSRAWLWGTKLDVAKHAVRVSEHNPAVPPNLYLVSSGAWPGQEPNMDAAQRARVAGKILESLQEPGRTWKLFCDTDGDRRPTPLTMLAYMLCRQAIVPLHLSKSDLDRTETMLGMMADLRERGEIQTQVAAIVWNCVKVYRDEPWEHSGLTLPFRPAKVSLDILDACNTRLYDTVLQLRSTGLFVHGDVDKAAFVRQSVLVVREIADNVLKPSEELGVSFASMRDQLNGRKQLPFVNGGVKYEASGATIQAVGINIEDLSSRLSAMALVD